MLRRWLEQRRERLRRIDKDARELVAFMGEDAAYEAARIRARESRAKGDAAADRHWSRVAVEIADETKRQIGVTGGDRFMADRPALPDPDRKLAAAELTDIAEAIARWSRGGEPAEEHELHNAEAGVYRLVQLSGSPEAESAGRVLRQALRDLAAEPQTNADHLASGTYHPRADEAGKALQRLRALVLPAR